MAQSPVIIIFAFLFASEFLGVRLALAQLLINANNIIFQVYNTNITFKTSKLPTDAIQPVNIMQPIIFIIHGWQASSNSVWVQNMTDLLIKKQPCSVITVDWSAYSSNINYPAVTIQVGLVGNLVGDFIVNVTRNNSESLANVHRIGHSLGAQVAGYAGQRVYAKMKEKVARISGLDAAGPLFYSRPDDQKLSKGDAVRVEAIHTNGGGFGYRFSYGSSDFFPNGGSPLQPGCATEHFDRHIMEDYLAAIEILDIADGLANQPARRFHVRDDAFELSDAKFVKLFRLSKPLVEELIISLEAVLPGPSRVSALDVETKVLTTLLFYAHGSYQTGVGDDINMAISQPSVSRSVNEVTDAINNNLFQQWISFPSTAEEIIAARHRFYNILGFPGAVGAIDCTHVAIVSPHENDNVYPEPAYVNRKGYHSVNVQLICDANAKIINVNSRFPGSTHDSYIWRHSQLHTELQRIYEAHNNINFYLLGDSGYALTPWLMTPILDYAPGSREEAYTTAHRGARCVIERCNGILKNRFRCLLKHRVLHYKPNVASKIVNACCVLHNICVENNIEPVDEDLPVENDLGLYNPEGIINQPQRADRLLRAGQLIQRNIVQTHF